MNDPSASENPVNNQGLIRQDLSLLTEGSWIFVQKFTKEVLKSRLEPGTVDLNNNKFLNSIELKDENIIFFLLILIKYSP